MKKAVINSGGKQYLVKEGEIIDIELLNTKDKSVSFEPMLIIDGETVTVGTPLVTGGKVVAEITEEEIKADKVTAIRYKAKKRVHKLHGHRQRYTRIKISKITSK
jgi:large subunit ribosomal protein L21